MNILVEKYEKLMREKDFQIQLSPEALMTIRYIVSAPFIYGMLVPVLFLHFCLEIYHQVAFRLYGISLVNTREYFLCSVSKPRGKSIFTQFNCWYCSYFRNILNYSKEIAAQTELYWCPIKENSTISDHSEYHHFMEQTEANVSDEEFSKKRIIIREKVMRK